MKKTLHTISLFLLITLMHFLSPKAAEAQCQNVFPFEVGTTAHFQMDYSFSYTNVYWSVNSIGTITGNRTYTFIDIQWMQAGSGVVSVVYNDNGVQKTQCWNVVVRQKLNGGTISTTATAAPVNEIISYTQFQNVTPPSGGLGQDYGAPYRYQWEESADTINWVKIAGATGVNCTGSAFFDKKLFIRRKVTDTRDSAYSNMVNVAVITALNGGTIGTSQVIQPGAAPGKLTSIVNAGSGNYQWESSTDETVWTAISGAAGNEYQPGVLNTTTYYRRKVSTGSLSAGSNVIQVIVKAAAAINKPDTTAVQSTQTKLSLPDYTGISSGNLNSITSYAIFKPGITSSSQLSSLTSKRDLYKATAYLDGLGRELETVQYQAGHSSQDLVSIAQYDQFGRQTVQHLPYLAPTDNNNKGQFRTDVATMQPSFYNTLTQNGEDFFYSQLSPEQSPAGRSVKSVLPGKSYAGKNAGNREFVRINDAGDSVRIWKVGNNTTDVPVSNSIYDNGMLTVKVITDAHEIKSFEYTDYTGRVVMTAQEGATGYYKNELRTYYVYDDIGNLRYVISPLATKDWWNNTVWDFGSSTTNRNILKQLCYKYLYDTKGRVISQEQPGIDGPSYFVYDNRNRLVFAKDSLFSSRNNGEWLLYFYDGMDRLLITALYKNTTATRESLQTLMDQVSTNAVVTIITPAVKDLYIDHNDSLSQYKATNTVTFLSGYDSGDNANMLAFINTDSVNVIENISVSNPLPGITGYEPLTIFYYDNYNWPGAKGFDNNYTLNAGSNPYADPVTPSMNVYGKLTGSKIKISGKNDWLKGTVFYDEKGRMIQSQQENIMGGTDVATTQYDFTGKQLSVFTKISNPQSTSDPKVYLQTRYEYENNQVKQIYHAISNTSITNSKLIAEYTYDDLNRVKSEVLGGGLETLNYDYDLLGRLKGINAAYSRNKSAGNYFGLELSYDKGFSDKKLDGNLSGVTWRRKGDEDKAHAYGYAYDNTGRLTNAYYTQNASGNWVNDQEDYTVGISQYDEGGNIVKMKQEGMLPGKVKATIDDLTYNYDTSGYRLKGVTDAVGDKNQGDFKNYTGRTGTSDYTYDVTGSLVKDKNRGVSVTYDFLLGKPQKISIDSVPDKYITYVYDAAGNVLQKILKNGAATTTYSYLEGAVYKDNVLQFVPHDEGRVRKTSTGSFVYDYFIADQLGSTRTVITEETNVYAYKATHEDNPNPPPLLPERELFSFPVYVDDIPVGHKFYDYNNVSNRKFVRLNYSEADRKIGTGKILRVMAGDQLQVGVLSYYATNSTVNNTPDQPVNDILNQLINVLLGPVSVVANGKGNLLQGGNGLILNKDDFNTFISNSQSNNLPSTTPKAYLNYVLFDDNFQMVSGGVSRVSQPGDVVPLVSQLNVSKNGYLYVYVSNESPSDVYFDDLVVQHTTGHLLQEDSYYPFGLQITGLSSAALNRMQNDYLYNGIEKITDFDLELYDAFYRNLDPQIGKWWQVDPAAAKYASLSPYNSNFNNPVNFADPLGDDPPWYIQFFMGLGRNGNSPILLNTVNVVAQSPILIRAIDAVGNSGAGEQIMNFTTSSFTAIGASMLSTKQYQARQMQRLAIDLQKIYGKELPAYSSYDAGTIKAFESNWGDKWAESDNFIAKATYKPLDGGWTTIQSLNPFIDPSSISHINGAGIIGNERVEGLVNITSEVVYAYLAGKTIGTVMPLLVGLMRNPGLTNRQLVQRAATKAENAIGGTGRFAGTAKHDYATRLLERYQSIYGYRGLEFKVRFDNGPGNRGVLDVLDNTNGIIYDWKFGYPGMTPGQLNMTQQMLKYQRNFGLPTQIIKP